jgi:hypothetical protein
MKLSTIATTTMAVIIHSTNSHAAATVKEGLNFATRDELRACQRLDEALAQRRENIEAMLTQNHAAIETLVVEAKAMVQLQEETDRADPAAVDAFNRITVRHNQHVSATRAFAETAEAERKSYDDAVLARNKQCAIHAYRLSDLNAVNAQKGKAGP